MLELTDPLWDKLNTMFRNERVPTLLSALAAFMGRRNGKYTPVGRALASVGYSVPNISHLIGRTIASTFCMSCGYSLLIRA